MWNPSLKCRGKEAGSPCLAGTGPTHLVVSLAPCPRPLPGLVVPRSLLITLHSSLIIVASTCNTLPPPRFPPSSHTYSARLQQACNNNNNEHSTILLLAVPSPLTTSAYSSQQFLIFNFFLCATPHTASNWLRFPLFLSMELQGPLRDAGGANPNVVAGGIPPIASIEFRAQRPSIPPAPFFQGFASTGNQIRFYIPPFLHATNSRVGVCGCCSGQS